jgi:hypothetical protein
MITDRIREDMTVISSDDCCVGFVSSVEDDGALRVTSIAAGYGYDYQIPLSWISDVAKYVYLDKSSAFVAANRQPLPPPSPKRHNASNVRQDRHSFPSLER